MSRTACSLCQAFSCCRRGPPTIRYCRLQSRKLAGGCLPSVHRRLYRADQLEAIDAARYIEELLGDLVASIGPEWEPNLIKDLHPLMLPADRVVGLGLVLNEVVTNANRYAYGGDAGPLTVTLVADRILFRLIVADFWRRPDVNARRFRKPDDGRVGRPAWRHARVRGQLSGHKGDACRAYREQERRKALI